MASSAAHNSTIATFRDDSIAADHAFDNPNFRAYSTFSQSNAGLSPSSAAGMNGQYVLSHSSAITFQYLSLALLN